MSYYVLDSIEDFLDPIPRMRHWDRIACATAPDGSFKFWIRKLPLGGLAMLVSPPDLLTREDWRDLSLPERRW